jgi:hypothetical protein
MAIEIVEYINLVFKAMRYTLIVLNSIVIIGALYFIIFGNDLAGNQLNISTGVLVILGLLAIIIAIVGIVAAVWWGNKTKIHLALIIAYVISALVLMIIGIILAAVYVRDMNSADVTLTVLLVILSVLIIKSSLGFAYVFYYSV